jgi:hypothetical protein
MKKLGWFAFFVIFSASCLDDPDCYQLHNDVIGVTFRVIGTGQGDSVLLRNFITQGEDAVITSFNATLNYFEEQGAINFQGEKENHFLEFGYTVKNQFVSEDCGSSFILSDLHVRKHNFDSVRVVSSTPTKGAGTNIEIYRCPETDTLVINFNQLYSTTNGITVSNRRSAFVSHPFESIAFKSANKDFSGDIEPVRSATIHLPVDTTKNETTYKFITSDGEDSLKVSYDRVTDALYRPCGVQTFIRNLTLGDHTFDSVSYGLNANQEPVRSLQDPHIANVRVFDCPKTNQMQVAFRRGTAAAQVTIKSITADHIPENMYKEPFTGAQVVLPLDLASNVSTFYIQYADDTIDTLSVQYAQSNLRFFRTCEDPIIVGLREVQDLPNIEVPQTTLQFPAVTNVQITVD